MKDFYENTAFIEMANEHLSHFFNVNDGRSCLFIFDELKIKIMTPAGIEHSLKCSDIDEAKLLYDLTKSKMLLTEKINPYKVF